MDEREQAILGSLFSADESEEWERAEREHRWATTPTTLHVNVGESEMISPSEIFSDGEMAALERQHRDAVARHRARFSERPEG